MILEFAKGLPLPTDAVTQKFAFLGRTGSGKSYAARRLVESLLKLRAHVVILDPVGTWHGLRAGERVSFEIPVLGGLHGDLPLAPTAGAVVARIVCERSTSMVLDVSQMHDAERTRFAEAFAREFFQLKKAAPSPVMLVLEEMQEFAPQNPNPGEQMMLHEFQRIAKLGRNFGIGLLGISQRPQECAKKVLNQTECVVAFQMTGPQERKALEYWLSDKGIEAKDLGKLLPTLEVGRPLLWSPQWLKRREVIEILPIETSDTSRTPKFGTVASTFQLRPIDISALKDKLTEATEAVAKDDPKALRARIKELEALAGVSVASVNAAAVDELANYTLHLQANHSNALMDTVGVVMDVEEMCRKLHTMLDTLKSSVDSDPTSLSIRKLKSDAAPAVPVDAKRAARKQRWAGEAVPKSTEVAPVAVEGLATGEAAILNAISQKKGGATKPYLTLVTGLAAGSIKSYTQRLVSKGLVARGDSGVLLATAEAFKILPKRAPLPTGKKLVEHYIATLPGGEAKVFSAVAAQAHAVSQGTIAKHTDLAEGSVKSYTQRLITRGLLERADGGVQLHSEFGL